MQLNHERPDYAFALRSADGRSAVVNERVLTASFILAPEQLIENWTPTDVAALAPEDMEALLAMQPEVILLGTGERQRFPAATVMAACLKRGVGLEAMTNAAAARTFNVLAGEARKVVAGFLFDANGPELR
ncbi:Mth938-like domain-containing protein [Pseudoxanthomonas wuyuanensis]